MLIMIRPSRLDSQIIPNKYQTQVRKSVALAIAQGIP